MRRLNGISRWSERDLITRRNRNSSHTKQLRMPWLPKSRETTSIVVAHQVSRDFRIPIKWRGFRCALISPQIENDAQLRLSSTRSLPQTHRRTLKHQRFILKRRLRFGRTRFSFLYHRLTRLTDRRRREPRDTSKSDNTGEQRNPFERDITPHHPLVMSHVALENVHGLDQQVNRGSSGVSGLFSGAVTRRSVFKMEAVRSGWWRSCVASHAAAFTGRVHKPALAF